MTDVTGNLPMLVLRALLSKRGWYALNHLVKVDSFESNEFRRLFQMVERAHGETAGDLTIPVLRADTAIHYLNKAPDALHEMDLVIDRLERTTEVDLDAATALVRRFLERSVCYEAAEYISNYGDKPEFNVATVADLAARAVEVGDRVGKALVNLVTSPLSGATDNRRIAHSLGCSRRLDRSLRGGVGDGELCILLAAPSGGKTGLLCRAGASHATKGGRVLHISMEVNSRKVIERYDQCWTGLANEDLESPEGQAAAQEARDRVRATGGHVWVADWSYVPTSANDIGALVRQMRNQRCECHDEPMTVDMVVIDYMMLMSPNKLPGRELRQKFSALGTEVRQLARNLDVPIVTAWQANRVGSDVLLLSRKDIAESWDTIMIADIILGLNQSDEEARNRRMRVNVIKQRESQDRGFVEIYCDLDRLIVRDLTVEDERALVNAVTRGEAPCGPLGSIQG